MLWALLLAQQLQSNWIEIGQTQLGDRVLVDESSVRLQTSNLNRSVRFNSRLMLASPEPDGTIKTTTSYTADCLRGSLIDSRSTSYDRSNQIVSNRNFAVAVPVREGSVGERLYNYACGKLPK